MHGDHNVVVEMSCSYCNAGLNKRKALGAPRPQGRISKKLKTSSESDDQDPRAKLTGTACPEPAWDSNDVLDSDFTGGFDLSQELWQCA